MENTSIEFRITGINIIYKNMEPLPQEGVTGTFHFDIKVDSRVQAERKLVIPFVTIGIRDGEKPEQLAKFKIACLFEIIDFTKHILFNQEENFHKIPQELEKLLRMVSLSTARGIVYSELRGTYLLHAIMPVVFIDNFKQEKPDIESVNEQIIIMK